MYHACSNMEQARVYVAVQARRVTKKNLKKKTSKKLKVLPKNAKSKPYKISVTREIINFLWKATALFSGRFQVNNADGFIMPPWILPPPHRKQKKLRIFSSLILSREAPKLRKDDVRKVTGGRIFETIEIRTEGCTLNQAIRDLYKFKNDFSLK